jgi:plastocyanin
MDGQCPSGIEVTQLSSQEFLFTLQNSCPDAQVSWFWNQNTPQTVMAQSIVHTFAEAGTYTVVAAVSDLDCAGGVTYLTTSVTVNLEVCNPQPQATMLGCGLFRFTTSVYTDSTQVYWTFSGDQQEYIGSTVQHYFGTGGAHTATMHFNGIACDDVVSTIAVESPNCNEVCSGTIVEIENTSNPCGTLTFQLPGIAPQGNYAWNFGDGESAGGTSTVTHTYASPGFYVVTASVWNAACPFGYTVNYTAEVPNCQGPTCPTDIVFSQTECGMITFQPNIEVQPNESVGWSVGNTLIEGREGSYLQPNGGNAAVCLFYMSDNCPGAQICETTVIDPCIINTTLQIDTLQLDGEIIVLQASGVDNPESTIWSINGTYFTTGNITTFVLSSTPILVCATYEGSDVTSPITNCFYLVAQNNNPCPEIIHANSVNECNQFVFWLENVGANDDVYWSFGNNTVVTGNAEIPFTFDAPGNYQIYAAGFSSVCGNQYGLTISVNVPDCFNTSACSDSLQTIATQTCGLFGFEVGSFQEGESAIWTFDNETVTGGHFIQYQFTSPGLHTISVFITSNDCPNGNFRTTTLNVPNCSGNGCSLDFTYVDYGCQGITFTATTVPITDYIEWYVNDIFYATGNPVNIVGPHGLQNVCARLSPNLCPDGAVACGQVYFQECDPNCSLIYIVGSSNVSSGSTIGTAYRVEDAAGNWLHLGYLSFSEGNYFAADSVCVPDGCYSILFDSNTPYSNGDGLNVTIYNPAGDVLADMNGMQPIDNYAFTLDFGLNSECGAEPENCNASFEIVTLQQGAYTFANTSSYAGNAEFVWNLGGGIISNSQDAYMTYTEQSEQTVCLSLVTATGCASDTCITFIAQPLIVDPCEGLTPVLIQLGSDLGSLTQELVLHVSVIAELGQLYENTFVLSPGQIEEIDFCAPAGCYEFNIDGTNWANLSDALVVNAFVNGVSLMELGLTENLSSLNTVLPVLTDCTISVTENSREDFFVYPNPANQEVNVVRKGSSANCSYQMFDQSGRIIFSGQMSSEQMRIDVSELASGLYILQLNDGINLSQQRVAVEH